MTAPQPPHGWTRRRHPTSRAADFAAGQRVSWWHQPRAGYCVGYYVDGVVVAVHKTRVTIRVKRANGVVVDRRIRPEHLTDRGELLASVHEVAHG